jgi:hypothetical protein
MNSRVKYLKAGEINIIWSLGPNDDLGNLAKHVDRGSIKVTLIEKKPTDPVDSGAESKVTIAYTIPLLLAVTLLISSH